MARLLFVVAMITVLAGLALSLPGIHSATPPQSTETQIGIWNSVAPSVPRGKPSGAKPAPPATPRDLTGIWDATSSGGIQAAGAAEHPAVYPGEIPGSDIQRKRFEGGQITEEGIANPVPYTPAGEKALERNLPSGQSVRAVPSVRANDPVDTCEPVGFPYLQNFEFRNLELIQTKNQLIYLGEHYKNWRVIWTDGRELPKNPKPRWDGYSVGHWQDDYTFVAETVGMNEKTWIDHAGRPHTKDLKVTEIYHLVDHDTLEHTEIINDPKYYTKPWMAQNKLILHRQPSYFDIRDFYCSPVDLASYNRDIGDDVSNPINPQRK